jgi:SAM-dependent methyltransferase
MRKSDYYSESYAKSHAAPGYGQHYRKTFRRGFYALEWECIEQPLLECILNSIPGAAEQTCLDFACGTGRIANVAARHMKRVVGVDIARSMIEAADPAPNVELRVHDLIAEPIPDRFQTATAFRFFLNAEQELRETGMAAISRHLEPGGLLIANVHINAQAPLGQVYNLRNFLTGTLRNRTLSHPKFVDLGARHGLRLKATHYYGYTPRPGSLNFPGLAGLMAVIERIGRTMPSMSRWLANSFICIFEKAG